MTKLEIQIQDHLGLDDRQITALQKFEIKIVEKALKSTMKYKPGDRKYFKDSLKYYSQPKKKTWEPYAEVSLSGEGFRRIKEENDKTMKVLLEKAQYYDCELCGLVKFHSQLRHDYKVHKASAIMRSQCLRCREMIAHDTTHIL